MKLEDLGEVNRLNTERATILNELSIVRDGKFMGSSFRYAGAKSTLDVYLGEQLIRQSAINACNDRLVAVEGRLAGLGVEVITMHLTKRDLADWKLLAEMYERAWREALGEPLPERPHLIDALTERTREIKKLADEFEMLRADEIGIKPTTSASEFQDLPDNIKLMPLDGDTIQPS